MQIATAALIIMLGNIASRVLGVVREQVIAALFGSSAATDAFTVADRIPRTVYDLIIGSMISALVPVFADESDESDSNGYWRLVSTVLTLLAIILAAVVVLLILIAPGLVAFLGYGYDAETQELILRLVRVTLPVVIFLGMAAIVTAILYARRRFLAPALAMAGYNAGIIVVALLFHEQLGVLSLAIGVLVGGLAQLTIQLIAFGRPRYRPLIDWRQPALRRILKAYLPVSLGVGITSIGVAIDTYLVSFTGPGSLSTMRFATTLVQFPLGLVATALSLAILPTLSRQATRALTESAGLAEFRATLGFGIRLVILAILPAAAGLLILREPIIQVLFQRGAFEAVDTARTATAFAAYSPGLVSSAIDQLLIAAFYARKDTLTPNLVAGAGVLVYLVVALSLIRPLGMPGLALANSAQITAHMIILWVLLERRMGGTTGGGLLTALAKAVGATAAMSAALLLGGALIGLGTPNPTVATGLRLVAFLALGAGVYTVALVVLRVDEAGRIVKLFRQRFGGGGGPSP